MKAIALLSAFGATFVNSNVITCDKPYGCAGHNVDTMTCNNDEDCEITCSDQFACRDIDIYGPEVTNSNSNERLSLSLDCTATYSCYGAKIHTNNLDTIKVTCSDFWSCAYMTIEGETANQVFVYVPDEGYYSFGSATVYCPITSNTNSNSISEDNTLRCSVECSGERSCYHSKFHNNNGMIDSSLVVGCNGALACNYAKLRCEYDSQTSEYKKECTMSCNDDSCSCFDSNDCIKAS